MPEELERLGPVGFQDLCAALTIATFGPGIQAMGPGRDGGRDMYFKGDLRWVDGESWAGYTVFQVKHKSTLADKPDANVSWLWGQIREELDAWAEGTGGRDEVPEFMVFMTNVPLTPTPESGGHDQILSSIRKYIDRLGDDRHDLSMDDRDRRRSRHRRLQHVVKWRVWDRHQINPLLTVHRGVRNAFPAFLTVGDVFEGMSTSPDWMSLKDVQPALRQQSRAALTGEGQIYFDEAGRAGGGGLPIHKVAIDLPVTLADGRRTSTVKYVLERAERMLKPRVTTFSGPRHLVLTGAPGNGKTTLSRFILQVFRAALLAEATDLSTNQRATINGVVGGLLRMGCAMPRNRRWAVRIDLADYAEQGGLDHESTLLRWIAEKVSARATARISPANLQTWMTRWPSLLILDGLDEVTEPLLRNRLLSQVTEFVDEAEAQDLDCLVLLTTRPVGYTENISPTHFEQIDMDYMSLQEASRYGELVSTVRLHEDPERLELLIRRFRTAVADESLKNLLRTPLQVLILTVIVENAGTLPPDRYSLFWEYFETILKRERSKAGTTRFLLNEHSQHIQRLHERVGLRLQALSEAADRSYAVLSEAELKHEIWIVLNEAGFQPAGKDSVLLDKVFLAATQRLVLIAPRGNEGYGFDVRSLQELMAARCLTTGPNASIDRRLRLIAPGPHWRNVLLFAAGRIFSEPQPHQHQALVELLENLDENASQRLGRIIPLAPRLALEIVDDGMLRSFPRWRSRLMQTGFKVLESPLADDPPVLARMLVRFADLGHDERLMLSDALNRAAAHSPVGAQTVSFLRGMIAATVDAVQAGALVRGLRLAGPATPTAPEVDPSDRSQIWGDFQLEVLTSNYSSAAVAASTQQAAELLARYESHGVTPAAIEEIKGALALRESSLVLEAALSHLCHEPSSLLRFLRREILGDILRQPVGEDLYLTLATEVR